MCEFLKQYKTDKGTIIVLGNILTCVFLCELDTLTSLHNSENYTHCLREAEHEILHCLYVMMLSKTLKVSSPFFFENIAFLIF